MRKSKPHHRFNSQKKYSIKQKLRGERSSLKYYVIFFLILRKKKNKLFTTDNTKTNFFGRLCQMGNANLKLN